MGPVWKKPSQLISAYVWIITGAFLAALSIRMFLYPNLLIDGGIVGVALIFGRLFGDQWISLFLLIFNLPFIYLAYRFIRRTFVIQMFIAVMLFAGFLVLLENAPPYFGDSLEIIALGGAILGIGAGLIIRNGGCLDGTEIMGIIINRQKGFTVGQVVLVANLFVFGAYGAIFWDWHIAVKSFLTYLVAFKMMDMVIVGLDELKSVMIISNVPDKIAEAVMNNLGLGLTVLYGKGGYSGDKREVQFVIVERLDLADLKEVILNEDPGAFITVQNLHEVVYGKTVTKKIRRKKGQNANRVTH
ncbi:MAG: YitT family protein [Chlamydiae bacterium]|nr:YitT family protein [Chlamydiota bacterium]